MMMVDDGGGRGVKNGRKSDDVINGRPHSRKIKIFKMKAKFIGGHSITTWTRRGGEGVHQMSTIVHVREEGVHCFVHMDKTLQSFY